MPPLFSSTSLGTLLRSIKGAAKYIHQPATVMARASPNRTIHTIHRARNAVQQVAHQTFPSLATPAHHLHHSGQPLRSGARGISSFSATGNKAPRRPLGAVGKALQAGGRVRPTASGPSVQANVGLGAARGFASGPAAGVHAKVPMGLRALASLIDDEHAGGKPLPRASRYSPYTRRDRKQRRRVCRSIDSSFISDLQHYFPLVRPAAAEAAAAESEEATPLPPLPETLVTAGKTTVLALPLSPSLDALLSPTPNLTYSETSIGVHVLARLTAGILPIHSAFSLHSSTRIIPLLTKLEGLGVMNFHPGSPLVTGEVIHDASGQPDILRLVFEDRSLADVHALLGESLRPGEEGEWWALWEEDRKMKLTQGERREMMEQWGEGVRAEQASGELIFPTLDMSVHTGPGEDAFAASLDEPLTPSSPRSGASSPVFVDYSPGSATPSTVSSGSVQNSVLLSASLLSQLGESSEDGWSIPASEADSDVDSVYAGSEEWRDVGGVQSVGNVSVGSAGSQYGGEGLVETVEDDEVVSVWWAGAGEGFGFVAQPW
ncbi:hypothetical protein IAT38_005182 [Cryptococcus sp. DSM 104549]